MYKVFLNEKPIVLTDKPVDFPGFEKLMFDETNRAEMIHKLQNTQIAGIVLYDEQMDRLWREFRNMFTQVPAAGGLVRNTKGEYLVIYRNGFWDMPKGKIDPGEDALTAARREVEEECGIGQLKIVELLDYTYHLFMQKSGMQLKIITWYLMTTTDENRPVPQREEGIEKAEFVSPEEFKNILPAMHGNLSEMLVKNSNKIF